MKILIFGVPGSGKTCLAQKLSKTLSLPIFHIDRHFFEKGWMERDHDHFLEDVRSALKTDQWIIDGNGMKTLEMRYKKADIAIYCRLSRLLCLYRIFYRWFSTAGISKPDGPKGATNSVSWKLIKYLLKFSQKYRDQINNLKIKYPKVRFFEVKSIQETINIQKDIF